MGVVSYSPKLSAGFERDWKSRREWRICTTWQMVSNGSFWRNFCVTWVICEYHNSAL